MRAKTVAGVAIAAALFALFILALLPTPLAWPGAAVSSPDVGTAMWVDRTYEVLLQGVILLSGVIGILMLLGSPRSKEAAR